MKKRKTEHVVRVGFSPNAMLRVLTLAASSADNDTDKRHVLTVADFADAFMKPHGGFHCKHPMIGNVDSFRALVEGIMKWVEDFADAGKRDADARNMAKAQELIDAVSDKIQPRKK